MGTPWFVIGIVFTAVVLPIIVIMHYVTKWKATKGLSSDEERLLEDLWKDSQAMQSRLNALDESAIVPTKRMPLNAASEQPMPQASIDDRSGRAPCNAASGRSSTAARIAIPARVWYSK